MALPDLYNLTADNTVVTADTTRYTADGSVFMPWVFDPAILRTPGTELHEIPIIDPPCSIAVRLGGRTVRMRFHWNDGGENASWILDLSDAENAPLVHGIPLLPGLDLLEPYAYLDLGFRLFVGTKGAPDHVPGFKDLGDDGRLYAELPAPASRAPARVGG